MCRSHGKAHYFSQPKEDTSSRRHPLFSKTKKRNFPRRARRRRSKYFAHDRCSRFLERNWRRSRRPRVTGCLQGTFIARSFQNNGIGRCSNISRPTTMTVFVTYVVVVVVVVGSMHTQYSVHGVPRWIPTVPSRIGSFQWDLSWVCPVMRRPFFPFFLLSISIVGTQSEPNQK